EQKEIRLAMQAGQRLRFRLHANPTVRKWEYRQERKGRTEGKRIGLYTEEMQRAWLAGKAQKGGFEVIDMRVTDHGKVTGRKVGENGTFRLEHLAVTFDGMLRVTDPNIFTRSIEEGIGSAKGFGFGLLSVVRA